jgi:hypothetical protein
MLGHKDSANKCFVIFGRCGKVSEGASVVVLASGLGQPVVVSVDHVADSAVLGVEHATSLDFVATDLVALAPCSDLRAVDYVVDSVGRVVGRMAGLVVDLADHAADLAILAISSDFRAMDSAGHALDMAVLAAEKSAAERSVARKKQRKMSR